MAHAVDISDSNREFVFASERALPFLRLEFECRDQLLSIF
jgi:hypothetical protein